MIIIYIKIHILINSTRSLVLFLTLGLGTVLILVLCQFISLKLILIKASQSRVDICCILSPVHDLFIRIHSL